MKERLVDGERAVVVHGLATVVADPGKAALDSPASRYRRSGKRQRRCNLKN